MDYLNVGKKIINDVSLFSFLCDTHGDDEEEIQKELNTHNLHLHRDGYNSASIQDNCRNAKTWLDFYRKKYGDTDKGYIELGKFSEFRTLACLDSIIDTLDAFISNDETTTLDDNSDYKFISNYISKYLQNKVKIFCNNKNDYDKIQRIIDFVLNTDEISTYISQGKSNKKKKERRGFIEDAINEHINEILERELEGNLSGIVLNLNCPAANGVDDTLLPAFDLKIADALLQLNRIVDKQNVPAYLSRWRELKAERSEKNGGKKPRKTKRRFNKNKRTRKYRKKLRLR